MVEGERRQALDRVPVGVGGEGRVEPERHQAEVSGGELPLVRVTVGVAERLELLEPGQLRDVDLARQLAADRALQRPPGSR